MMVAIPIFGASAVRARDFDVYEDQGPHQSATTTALLVLATFFVGLRFWARYLKSLGFASDDYMLVAALVVTFVTGGLNYGSMCFSFCDLNLPSATNLGGLTWGPQQ